MKIFTLVILTLLAVTGTAVAGDAFYDLPVNELVFEGNPPTVAPFQNGWRNREKFENMRPSAILDGEGDIFLRYDWQTWNPPTLNAIRVAIRAPEGKPARGQLLLSAENGKTMTAHPFTVPASAAKPEARNAFLETREIHYRRLLDRDIPGGAWFRHNMMAAANERLGKTGPGSNTPTARRRDRGNEFDRTLDLLTGGRAVSENLQLDRDLFAPAGGGDIVDTAGITGITVQEMNWAPLIKDIKPETDPLAALVPADQHALFFPSFAAMLALLDEADANGTPLLQWFEPRAEDARTKERCERQLCLSTSAVARLLGPQVVTSVAFTGSDAYIRTGSDVAILFETVKPDILLAFLAAKHAAARQTVPGVSEIRETVEGIPCQGVMTADRVISSFVAVLGNTVVVSNSRVQIRKIIEAAKRKNPALVSAPEYMFFRNRYPRSDKAETAFLVLPDAAIRRWCGPAWRIGSSRRTRAAAILADYQATRIHYREEPDDREKLKKLYFTHPPLGDIQETSDGHIGYMSSIYGTLDFQTPIAEMNLAKVTKPEADAYARWRDTYQQNWRQYFDPIAARVSVSGGRLAADVTVMPLIAGTDYREFLNFTSGAKLAPGAGDPHTGTLYHIALAINPENDTFRRQTGMFAMMAPGLGANPLGWLGKSVALYADTDPFWDDMRKSEDPQKFVEKEFPRLPIALYLESNNALKLAVFLTGLRAFIEQSSPGMVRWETLTHNDQSYVKITPTPGNLPGELDKLAIFYVPTPDSLVITLNENVLKRALDRQAARKAAKAEGKDSPIPAGEGWLGDNLGLRVDRNVLDVLQGLFHEDYQAVQQARAWGNIPILNEWKRLFPNEDPVAVHEKYWGTRLVCPGGGTYVWNDQWKTMESTVYGHPAGQKTGPAYPAALANFSSGNFGLSFENQGVRARVELLRNQITGGSK
ncbi:MAG: hypothetical protein V1809_15640 [Planctomycetota bacterium]